MTGDPKLVEASVAHLQAAIGRDPTCLVMARRDPAFRGVSEDPSFRRLVGLDKAAAGEVRITMARLGVVPHRPA